jgi:hypothetical protein
VLGSRRTGALFRAVCDYQLRLETWVVPSPSTIAPPVVVVTPALFLIATLAIFAVSSILIISALPVSRILFFSPRLVKLRRRLIPLLGLPRGLSLAGLEALPPPLCVFVVIKVVLSLWHNIAVLLPKSFGTR